MATRTLLPGATDLSQAASWSGATLPTNGDDVRFVEGSQTITAGLATGIAPASVYFGPLWRGRIDGLSYGNITALLANYSRAYIRMSSSGTVAKVEHQGQAPFTITGGTITVYFASGVSEFMPTDGVDVASAILMHASGHIMGHASEIIHNYQAAGGSVKVERDIDKAIITSRHNLLMEGDNLPTVSDGSAGGQIDIYDSVFKLNSPGVTCDDVKAWSGLVDLFDNPGDVTFTDATRTSMSRMPDRWANGSLTITEHPRTYAGSRQRWRRREVRGTASRREVKRKAPKPETPGTGRHTRLRLSNTPSAHRRVWRSLRRDRRSAQWLRLWPAPARFAWRSRPESCRRGPCTSEVHTRARGVRLPAPQPRSRSPCRTRLRPRTQGRG